MKAILLVLLFIISLSSYVTAEEVALDKDLRFEWVFPKISDTAGFKIYVEGTREPMMTINDPDARVADSVNYNVPIDKSCYTMTAFDIGGQESGHSEQYCIDPPPPIPTGFKIVWALVPVE